MYLTHLIIIFIIIIVIFVTLKILKYYAFRKKIYYEHFYTLFLPYYYPDTIKKYNFYKKPWDNKYEMFYKINFLISNMQLRYTNLQLFMKSLIAYNFQIFDVNLLATNNDRKIIGRIESNNVQMGVISAPILVDQYLSESYPNLRYITSLNEQFIFLITPTNRNLDTLSDLRGKKIGVGAKNSLWHQCADDIFKHLKYDYIPFYDTLLKMMGKLYNGKIDAVFITDSYPGHLVNFIFYNFYSIQLISFEKFYYPDFYFEKTKIDLNKMPALYLPIESHRKKYVKYVRATLFDNNGQSNWKHSLDLEYFPFTPDFVTLKFSNYLLTNYKVSDRVVYLMITHIFNNKLMIDKSTNPFTFLPIELHPGAKKYYQDYGYISYIPDKNCKYLYGKQRCTYKTLYNNKILF